MTDIDNKWPEPGNTIPMWICPRCTLAVPYGQEHNCPCKNQIDEYKIDRIIELLEQISAKLEHLDHNIGAIEYSTRRMSK